MLVNYVCCCFFYAQTNLRFSAEIMPSYCKYIHDFPQPHWISSCNYRISMISFKCIRLSAAIISIFSSNFILLPVCNYIHLFFQLSPAIISTFSSNFILLPVAIVSIIASNCILLHSAVIFISISIISRKCILLSAAVIFIISFKCC